ncbi:MAG: ferritin-like domain-containing protein [Acidimicrobiales bacterium]
MGTDIAKLIQRSARLEIDDIDFDAFRTRPLDPNALRCLRYMHDVEGHTICYLRDILVTRAHRDPEVTAFLACWSYEEHWHGEAIGRVLDAHGENSGASRLIPMRQQLPRNDSLRPAIFSAVSAVTKHLPAVHMAWGAVNEWTTQTGYARLVAKAKHPVLAEVLRRIMRQEGRHIDFYAAQAAQRLGSSRAAQRLTRYALRRFWGPVGSGVMPEAEVRFLATYLFGDERGLEAANRVDRHIDRLPGLQGLHLLTGAVEEAMVEGLAAVPEHGAERSEVVAIAS